MNIKSDRNINVEYIKDLIYVIYMLKAHSHDTGSIFFPVVLIVNNFWSNILYLECLKRVYV